MRVTLRGFALNPAGAQRLKSHLSAERSSRCADAFVEHLLSMDARYAIIEDPYIDQDYSADYLNFYGSAFREYPRHTKRIHFFSEDVSALAAKEQVEQNEFLSSVGYLGFVVVRPIAQGPIGRSVLKFPVLPGLAVRFAARAKFKGHLLGAELEIQGAPFIQQDQRLGACAQAAIWMADRPVHERHRRTPWYSIAEITRFATTPTDTDLSRSLPSGSEGLNPVHIIRAFRAMGHQPLFDLFMTERGGADGKPMVVANGLAAPEVVRYLDSGLPVVIALAELGHAMTAVGYVETKGGPCREAKTYDAFIRALIVHDDQRGPYRLMPLTQADIPSLPRDRLLMNEGEVMTVEKCVTHMFVPLPPRVFLRADRVDIVSRDYLKHFVDKTGPQILDRVTSRFGSDAAPAVTAFYEMVKAQTLIQRTYLTTAGRYRRHLAKSELDDEIKAELLQRTLPHFVYVTELFAPDGDGIVSDEARKIIGHVVLNAISSTDPDSDLLMAHLPHVVVNRDVNPPPDTNRPFTEIAATTGKHAPYRGRVRR